MKGPVRDGERILALSRLFSYPQGYPGEGDLKKAGVTLGGITLQALQAEYVRLFINALPETVCPPYGACYLEGTLMGRSTTELRDLYAAYGFSTEEMPDHIAVELEFLALLCMAPKRGEVGEGIDTLLVHLRSWTPRFFEQVEVNDTVGFFRRISRSARGLLLDRPLLADQDSETPPAERMTSGGPPGGGLKS